MLKYKGGRMMSRKGVVATLLVICGVLAVAGGIWWYYEENVKITLPVNEKTAIRIGKAAIEEKYPEYTIGKVLDHYNIDYYAIDEEENWEVVWKLKDKKNPNIFFIMESIVAIVEKSSGNVIEVRFQDEG